MRRVTATMLAFIAMLSASPALADPIVIKFSHNSAEQSPKGQTALKFKELVEKRLQGKVKVEVYPNAKLFNDEDVIEALLRNEAQLAAPSLSKLGQYSSKLDIFALPFLFNDLEAVNRFQSGPAGQALLMSMADEGIVGLGYLHNGMKQFSANKPLRVPDDAKGLRFRVEASDVLVAEFEAVGAAAVKKPFSEVYGMMQTKAVDGSENTWSNIYTKKFYEVQSHIMESNHGVIDYMVVTSEEFWSDLPAEIRDDLKRALDDAIAYGNQVAAEQATLNRQQVIQSGRCEVMPLTLAERAKWVTAMVPVWNRFESAIGAELITAALDSNKVPRNKRRKVRHY